MRAVLGVVSLLVVLALVGLLAVRQLRATGQPVGAALPLPMGVPGTAAPVNDQAPPQSLPQQVKADLAKALEQGAAARKEETDK